MRSVLSLLALVGTALAQSGTISATPHDSYSSSIGVLGCKVDVNRIAYWPMAVDCNNICVKVSKNGRSVYLLRVDQSGGAYDMSYDAWNYLMTGKSATEKPLAGGGESMDYEFVDASKCASLIHTSGHKLPLSAPNSMNYIAACRAQSDSWVAKHHALYNICDPVCSLGNDEECQLNMDVSNQPQCPHQLGLQTPLRSVPVYNIKYPTGNKILAITGQSA